MHAQTSKTVDGYLSAVPEVQRNTLEKVRKAIRSVIPAAEEVISYQIPTFNLNGPVAAIAAFKNHCSYFTMSDAVMKEFENELKPYDTRGVTIHFPIDKPLPASLVKKLVQAKVKENEMKQAARNKNHKTKKQAG